EVGQHCRRRRRFEDEACASVVTPDALQDCLGFRSRDRAEHGCRDGSGPGATLLAEDFSGIGGEELVSRSLLRCGHGDRLTPVLVVVGWTCPTFPEIILVRVWSTRSEIASVSFSGTMPMRSSASYARSTLTSTFKTFSPARRRW